MMRMVYAKVRICQKPWRIAPQIDECLGPRSQRAVAEADRRLVVTGVTPLHHLQMIRDASVAGKGVERWKAVDVRIDDHRVSPLMNPFDRPVVRMDASPRNTGGGYRLR